MHYHHLKKPVDTLHEMCIRIFSFDPATEVERVQVMLTNKVYALTMSTRKRTYNCSTARTIHFHRANSWHVIASFFS